ncbi:MAG TPA: lysophospholipid acyltransferase family protein [Steroidobacteraceae bacterium]|nr:lysophospholipid acyltransferase family protein [Steroidobacteraceae bacterium]
MNNNGTWEGAGRAPPSADATGGTGCAAEGCSDVGSTALWIRAVSQLPFALLYALAGALAFLLRYVVRYRVPVARANLRRCFPDRSNAQINRLLRLYYRHLAQVAVEFLKTATMSAEALNARVALVHLERVHAEFRAGRSVLLLGAHQCNWEWSLQAVALHLGAPMDAAYKPLHAAAADRQMRQLRCRFGARLVTAKRLIREVVRRRHEIRAVALIADQVPASSDGRLWLRFLGLDTAFYPGPAEIARSTGYAAFFVAMRRTGRGHYELDFQPISAADERLEPASFTSRYARLLETLIRAHPTDWNWTHRRWKLVCPQELSEPQALAP